MRYVYIEEICSSYYCVVPTVYLRVFANVVPSILNYSNLIIANECIDQNLFIVPVRMFIENTKRPLVNLLLDVWHENNRY